MKIDFVGKEKLSIPDAQREKPSKRITFVTGLLLALLGIRLIISLIIGSSDPLFTFDILIYIAAITGVSLKAKWGSLLALGYHSVGLILALSFILGSSLTLNYHVWKIFICDQDIFYILGTAFMDILIVGLAWREYTTLGTFDGEKIGITNNQSLKEVKMFCPNCGKEQVDNPKFCPSCGAKLVQESVIQSDIEPEIKSSVEPRVSQGIQPKSRSAALKWGTGVLFAITVLYLIGLIELITLSLMGYAVPFIILQFITLIIVLAAAIYAVRRRHWGYVLGATIWLLVIEIIAALNLFVGVGPWPVLPEEIAIQIFALLLSITCLILISRTKAEFS